MILLILFATFFEIGAFTFGGGYAMLPLIREKVLEHGWMPLEQLVDFIAVSESTPGPFAINMATYVGSVMGGRELSGVFGSIPASMIGAACATLGVVLPSFIIILIVAQFYEKFKESSIVKGMMSGLRPAVIGMIGVALLSMVKTVFLPNDTIDLSVLATPDFWVYLATFALCAILAFKKKHPILIILISAVIGITFGYIA